MSQKRVRAGTAPAFAAALILLTIVATILSGCLPAPQTGGASSVNPTLVGIMVMLTQTAGAPTATITPTVTPVPPQATPMPIQATGGVVGQQLTSGRTNLVVIGINSPQELDERKPSEGMAYLNTEVLLRNQSTEGPNLLYAPIYFRLVDNTGKQYMPMGASQLPRLLGGELQPGEIVRGNVTFEVPASSGGFSLQYTMQDETGGPTGFVVDLSQTAGTPNLGAVDSTTWMGEQLTGRDRFVNASGIKVKVEMAIRRSQFGVETAKPGRSFLVLSVVIGSMERPNSPYNPEYFKIKDENGYEYRPLAIPSDDVLGAGTVDKGQIVRGDIVFDIPEGVKQVGAIYKPQVLSEDYEEMRIRVKIPN